MKTITSSNSNPLTHLHFALTDIYKLITIYKHINSIRVCIWEKGVAIRYYKARMLMSKVLFVQLTKTRLDEIYL